MSKRKSKDLSRRDFLRVSVGAVVATSIGCNSESSPGVGGTGGDNGQGVIGGSGNSGTTNTGAGGGLPKTGAGAGGRATGTGGVVTGGTTTAGGSGKPGVAGKTGATGGKTAGGGTTASGGAGSSGGGGSPLVGMVRGTDWAKATRDAIDMVGGLPDLTGKTVMLRPNVISSQPSPTTTNPEVIRGAIQAVKAKGATKIIVAEDGFAAGTGLGAMTSLGITQVCTDEGAEAMDMKGSGGTVRSSPTGAAAWPNGINFYKAVLDADFVINMPVCKTHSSANISMALKAWYGNIPVTDRNHASLMNQLPELHLVRQENFVILDASKCMISGGPTNGMAAESKIVVATKDPIAADITGICILKQFGVSGAVANTKVWEQQQIKRALALKFNGWLSSAQNFAYQQNGVTDHEAIMAWRDK